MNATACNVTSEGSVTHEGLEDFQVPSSAPFRLHMACSSPQTGPKRALLAAPRSEQESRV